jgi:hypothetical protein
MIGVIKVKVSRGITQCPPTGLELLSCTQGILMAHYLNVRQRKLGTIIIQIVHIQQHDFTVTGSLLSAQEGIFAWATQPTSN